MAIFDMSSLEYLTGGDPISTTKANPENMRNRRIRVRRKGMTYLWGA